MTILPSFRAAFVLAALALPLCAQAADPAKPLAGQTVTILEPFGRDSVSDLTLRLLKPGLEQSLGAKVVPEFVRSPEGTAAFERVAKAKPDGLTLLVMTDATRLFYEALSGSKEKLESLTPVAKLTDGVSLALVTAAASPITDYKTLFKQMREAKRRPTIALYSASSPAGVFAAILEDDIGNRFGARSFLVDHEIVEAVQGRKVEVAILPSLVLLNKKYQLRGLLTSGARRNAALPDVPTLVDEAEKRKLSFTVAVGLFGPPNLSPEVTQALAKAAADAARTKAAQSGASAAGLPLAVNDGAVLREAMGRTQRVIRDLLAP